MEWIWKILLGIVGYAIGLVAASWPTSQIGCTLFCAFPLLHRLRNYSDCFNLKGCRRLFTFTVLINAAILVLVIGAVAMWAPGAMALGFWIGYGFTLLLGLGQFGINENNAMDFLGTINKFTTTTDKEKVIRALDEALQ